jgi:hypothetical protein
MPRGPRLDAPGVLHHVIARGIERQLIFRADIDRDDFIGRFARPRVTGGARRSAHRWCERWFL